MVLLPPGALAQTRAAWLNRPLLLQDQRRRVGKETGIDDRPAAATRAMQACHPGDLGVASQRLGDGAAGPGREAMRVRPPQRRDRARTPGELYVPVSK